MIRSRLSAWVEDIIGKQVVRPGRRSYEGWRNSLIYALCFLKAVRIKRIALVMA